MLFRNKNKKMYYSQCGEDQFLNENIIKNMRNGTYIELGALDGVLFSNTKFFEDNLGWKGILIEPNPYQFNLLTKNRPNNHLFNNLVSCHTEPLNFKYFVGVHAAVSGVEDTLPHGHFDGYFNSNPQLPQSSVYITPRTLTDIVKSTGLTHINLLSLDVEGHEYEVLQSWDFSIKIDIILIEMLEQNQEKDQMCRDILIKNGYTFFTKYKHNEIFIHNNK